MLVHQRVSYYIHQSHVKGQSESRLYWEFLLDSAHQIHVAGCRMTTIRCSLAASIWTFHPSFIIHKFDQFRLQQVNFGVLSVVALPHSRWKGYLPLTLARSECLLSSHESTETDINGNFRILKWRYCTVCLAIFCGDIHLHRPYIGLIYGRYLRFRFLKWPLMIPMIRSGWKLRNPTPVDRW